MDVILCLIACRLTTLQTAPVLNPVPWYIAGATGGQATRLFGTAKTILGRHAKEFEPLQVILSTARCFRVLCSSATLKSTVDDVNSCAEGRIDTRVFIDLVGFEKACHDIMHAWLRVLRSHIEPNTGSHRQSTALMD